MTTYEQDYVAADLWPTLNVLDNSGFAAYNIPESSALDGRVLKLRLDTAGEVSVWFSGGGAVELREGSVTTVHQASIKEVDEGLFLVHFVRADDEKAAVVLVLDLYAGVVTVVRSSIVPGPAKGGLFAEEDVDGGTFDGASTERHQRTADLVGRRVQYVYGPDNAYEHIYLHENAYAWQCLAGAEKGLADVDRARVWKIREDVYLLTWQEKVVPCDGVVILNFRADANQSTGRIWGYDTDAGTTNAIAMGARAVFLNHTAHDPATWTA